MPSGIEIRPSDPDWPEAFARERDRLASALGALALRIDHHGSTSVPGLDAKPVIDIQISVARLTPLATYAAPLAALGYTHVPHEDDAVCPFFHRPAAWPHTHHVHVVQAGSRNERDTIAFRDYLRRHPETADEYAALKHRLAQRFADGDFATQQEYADAKSEFVARVLDRAAVEAGYDATREG